MITINEMRRAMSHPIFASDAHIRIARILYAMADCEQELFDYVTDEGLVFDNFYARGNELDEIPSTSQLLDVVRPARLKADLPLLDALNESSVFSFMSPGSSR